MDNLPPLVATLILGGSIAVILAFFVARKSHRNKPVKGGALAHLLHYLGALGVVAPAPLLLVGGFGFRIAFGQAAGLCLGSLGLGFLALMLFAVFSGSESVEAQS